MIETWFRWFRQKKFLALLVSLSGLSVIQPILEDIGLVATTLLSRVFLTIVLFSCIHAVSENRRRIAVAMLLGIPSFGAYWFAGSWKFNLVGLVTILAVMAAFFLFIVWNMLSYVLKKGLVTGEKIAAAVCVYMLLGHLWALLYSLLQALSPRAFNIGHPELSDFVYYSFITLSTVGYGDITPLTASARALAYVEAITGQIYLAVLVAGLVGMHITSREYQVRDQNR